MSVASSGKLIDDFPEKPNDYPNLYYLYKQLPAYGMYLRHVKNIRLEKVHVSCDNLDPMPMLMRVDVKKFQ